MMVGMALNDLGDLYNRRGDHARALPYCERAVAIATADLPTDHPLQVGILRRLGEALLGLGRTGEARVPLERALAIGEHAAGDPVELAAVQLVRARALADHRGDRARARVLATAARTAYVDAGARKQRELAAAEAWLAAHP